MREPGTRWRSGQRERPRFSAAAARTAHSARARGESESPGPATRVYRRRHCLIRNPDDVQAPTPTTAGTPGDLCPHWRYLGQTAVGIWTLDVCTPQTAPPNCAGAVLARSFGYCSRRVFADQAPTPSQPALSSEPAPHPCHNRIYTRMPLPRYSTHPVSLALTLLLSF